MATVTSTIQALVDNLHSKMTSSEPLSPVEQTLMATAIDKLLNNTSVERTLLDVATEYLSTAIDNMDAISKVLDTTTVKIDEVQTELHQQTDSLTTLPQLTNKVQSSVDNVTDLVNQQYGPVINKSYRDKSRQVYGVLPIEEPSTNTSFQRSQAVFAVYDASGESYLSRPAYSPYINTVEYQRLEFLKLLADGSNKSVLATHFVHSESFFADPETYIYRFGCNAIIPLATKADSHDIQYEIVYSCQSAANGNGSSYGGIFCRSAGSNSLTKPKANINAVDSFGMSTITNHTWLNVAVLYDNIKHCLVLVDANISKIIEKYRDGNITRDINIASSADLQTYVDNGDFTVVKFITNELQWTYAFNRYGKTVARSNNSHKEDMFGHFGKYGSSLRMGGYQYSAHYRFTSDKKLEPLVYHFASTVNNQGTSAQGHNVVSITDMRNNILGKYHYSANCGTEATQAGNMANAIMCINPYSHIGVVNEYSVSTDSAIYYGVARICRAF